MPSPAILDFEQLLKPISDEQPSGPELKEDDRLRGVYQAVKDARETARVAEKKLYQAAWLDDADTSSLERPDWKKVFDLASETIARQPKDLWISAWLIESLARLHGFAGLRDGFRLTRELVERFWDGIHPRPDEEGYATTVAQLTGLNGDDSEGALIAPIDRIPITDMGKVRALSSADYKQALELEKLDPEKRRERIQKGTASLDMFQSALQDSSPEFFTNLLEDIQSAIDEYLTLVELLDSRCGTSPDGYPAAPPSSAIRAALTDVRERVQNLTKSILGSPDSSEGVAAGGTEGAAPPAAGSTSKGGMNREEAFRQLLQVAEFFRRTEPHSPVSYALEQAVRWGRMSLPDLLNELIGDSTTRDELFKRVGLRKPEVPE